MATAARVYLFLGAAGCLVYVAIGGSDLIYIASGSSAVFALAVGIWRNAPASRGGWLLYGGGIGALALADIIYFEGYASAPFPSAADAFYLLGTLTLCLALLALVGARRVRLDPLAMADTGVLALALGLFLWSSFFSDAFGSGTGVARVVSIAYPVLDMLLLAILIRVLLEPGRRTFSYYLVGLSVVLLVSSDAWYVVPALTDHYVAGTWRDVGWLAAYICAGAAALDPSMRVFVSRRDVLLPLRRVVLLGASLVTVAVAMIVQYAVDGTVEVYAFGIAGASMAAFVTVRLAGLVKALDASRHAAQQSERRFRLVFERSPVGISVGRDGVMSETNPALQRLLGYSAGELAAMHYTDVTHPDDQDLAVQLELDNGDRDAFIIDKRYRTKDGGAIDAHVHVALDVEDGLGISLIEDVTARRELEEQLRQAQKMEAVGKLAGGIAHDFNNLMTAVLGYSDLILRRLEPGDVNREKLEAIRESAVRASELTRQLLAFGRRQMLQTKRVDLREVVSRMDALLQPLTRGNVRVELQVCSDPALVHADPTQLEQVLMNLAVNAHDAMPHGGTLRTTVKVDDRDVILVVADTGTGMDAATRERIFEPFFTTKAVGEGSGLGLSSVHGIVGQSGGTIDVETSPGGGTTFTVRLPRVALPVSADAATLVD
jgi:PAS domain S-box-containing protein